MADQQTQSNPVADSLRSLYTKHQEAKSKAQFIAGHMVDFRQMNAELAKQLETTIKQITDSVQLPTI